MKLERLNADTYACRECVFSPSEHADYIISWVDVPYHYQRHINRAVDDILQNATLVPDPDIYSVPAGDIEGLLMLRTNQAIAHFPVISEQIRIDRHPLITMKPRECALCNCLAPALYSKLMSCGHFLMVCSGCHGKTARWNGHEWKTL